MSEYLTDLAYYYTYEVEGRKNLLRLLLRNYGVFGRRFIFRTRSRTAVPDFMIIEREKKEKNGHQDLPTVGL